MKIPITVSTPATIFTKIYVDVMDMTESHHGYKLLSVLEMTCLEQVRAEL